MVKLCAFLAVLVAASPAGAITIDFLAAELTENIIAQGSTNLNLIEPLAADSNGVVYGSVYGFPGIRKVDSGVYTDFTTALNTGPVRVINDSTILVGAYSSLPAVQSVLYTMDPSGNFSLLATLPEKAQIHRMAVSPANGDILLTATYISGDKILKYNSAGALQWEVANQNEIGLQAVAYTPSGQGYIAAADGKLHAIDSANGSLTQAPFGVSTDYASATAKNIFDMVFVSDEYLIASTTGGNDDWIVRTNITTGETDPLVHWEFNIPSVAHWLDYTEDGLYTNAFDPADAGSLSESVFGLRQFNLASDVYGVQLFTGDFTGQFSGVNGIFTVPEPCTLWLVVGLLATRKKRAVRNRQPVRSRTVR